MSIKSSIIRLFRGSSDTDSAAEKLRGCLQQDLDDLKVSLTERINAEKEELLKTVAELRAEIKSHVTGQVEAVRLAVDRCQQDINKHLDDQTADLMGHTNHQTSDLTLEIRKTGGCVSSPELTKSSEQRDQLAKQSLFIVGCARSGTSILADCLNLSPEVYLLQEANLFANFSHPDFVEWYNQMHRDVNRNDPRKGTFLVNPGLAGNQPGIECLEWLAKNHKHVGEKIAFGPHGKLDGRWPQEVFFDFHGRRFGLAKYILIFRDPIESVWSMLKMFQGADPLACFGAWFRTLDVIIDVYSSFESAWVVAFNRFDSAAMTRLAEKLQIGVDLPPQMISQQHVKSNLPDRQIPEALTPFAELGMRAREIFTRTADAFSPESFRYCGSEYSVAFFGSLKKELKLILEELGQPG